MKKYIYWISLLFLYLAQTLSHADVIVNLSAGNLTSNASAPMQIDTGSNNGSLLLLIDLGAENILNNNLTAGQYVSGTNTIFAAGSFNNFGGSNVTTSVLTATGSFTLNDQIALRWFPQITYAQYLSGFVTPAAGYYYGSFDPAGGSPDGSDSWIVPSSGTITLNFLTLDTGAGSQPIIAGNASFVVNAVPEPSLIGLVSLGLFAFVAWYPANRRQTAM